MIKINESNRIDSSHIQSVIKKNLKNTSHWIKRMIKKADMIENIDYVTYQLKSTGGRPLRVFELTVDAAKKVCVMNFNTSKESLQLYKYLVGLSGYEVIIEPRTRGEVMFDVMIHEILDKLVHVIPQYNINCNGTTYRVDFYIPECKLAIEFDEHSHEFSTRKKLDKIRQSEIEKNLKCKFIRIKRGLENSGINEILLHIFKDINKNWINLCEEVRDTDRFPKVDVNSIVKTLSNTYGLP